MRWSSIDLPFLNLPVQKARLFVLLLLAIAVFDRQKVRQKLCQNP